MSNNKEKMKQYKVLAAAVREVLVRDWHPIEVCEWQEPQDEYDSYIPVIVKMILEHAGTDRIARHLTHLQTDNMGLSCQDSESNIRRVAEKLVQLVT